MNFLGDADDAVRCLLDSHGAGLGLGDTMLHDYRNQMVQSSNQMSMHPHFVELHFFLRLLSAPAANHNDHECRG